jgi:hypothetical protein
MGSCHPLRFAAILVARALVSASQAVGEAMLSKDVNFLKAPELKDCS